MKRSEAIEIVRKKCLCEGKETLEALRILIPELKESEDEKIRNFLIDFIKVCAWSEKQYLPKEDCVAWLEKQGEKINIRTVNDVWKDMRLEVGAQASGNRHEPQYSDNSTKLFSLNDIDEIIEKISEKQGEQKPDDKVKTKQNSNIEKGKWYVCDTSRYADFAVGKAYYCPKNGMLKPNENEMARYVAKYCFHLWTIQDAKDGDVLSFNDGHGNDSIELIKSITDKKIEFWFCLTNGNRYEVFDGITPYTNLVSREDATPATKEQCDQLEKAMADAGYRWNPDEKKMEKVEQNPAWSEKNEAILDALIRRFEGEDILVSPHLAVECLKTLKERYTWKPTREMLHVLEKAMMYVDSPSSTFEYKGELETLYQNLKSL